MDNSFIYRLRLLHGKLHTSLKKPYIVTKGFLKSLKPTPKKEPEYPVDFVVTWVDGGDPKWQAKKARFQQDSVQNKDGAERYRDWNIFRYWFRAVEQYAPWVHKVFLVTDDQIPDFINDSCEKLVIVDHREIIDNTFLPVFNSCAIEANIYKIPDLSEHFIYFNDDVFLSKPVSVSDFFCNGKPRYTAQASPLRPPNKASLHAHQVMTCAGLINRSFNIRQQMEDHCEKWFNFKNRKAVKRNLLMYQDGFISSFAFSHLGVPYLKSTWETVAERFHSEFAETSSHRFRSCFDVVHVLIIMWEMMTGNFEPVKHKYFGIACETYRTTDFEVALKVFRKNKYIMVCFNDNDGLDIQTFEQQKKMLSDMLREMLPGKSLFEK